MVEEKLIIMVQETACLYNWQHKDYDNLVKDSCSKETATGTCAKGKEQAAQYVVHHTKAHWCEGKAPLTMQKKQYIGGSARVARQPNGVTRSRCGSSETLLEKCDSYTD